MLTVRRLLFVAAVSLIMLLGGASAAAAHAQLERSTPSDGERVEQAPPAILITFTEPLDADLSAAEVVDQHGGSVVNGPVQTRGNDLVIPVEALPDGSYLVAWNTTSTIDGHPLSGTFTFGVGEVPQQLAADDDAAPLSAMSVVGRVLLYLGLSLLLGLAGYQLFATRAPFAPGTPLAVGTLMAIAGVWYAAAAGSAAAGMESMPFLGTASARPLLLQALGVALIVGAALWMGIRPSRRSAIALAATVGLVLLAHATGAHAGAEAVPALSVAVQFAHMVAVGLWLGGLAWVLIHGLRSPVAAEDEGPRRDEVARFSRVATWCIVVVGVTGLGRAFVSVGGPGGLIANLDTIYVRMVLVKVVLFVAVAILGALNRRRVQRRELPARRIVVAELGVAILLFSATAVLSRSSPPQARVEPVASAEASGGGTVDLYVTPLAAGQNDIRVVLPVDVDQAELLVEPVGRDDVEEATVPLSPSRTESMEWVASGGQLAFAGPWSITLVGQGPAGTVAVPFEVEVPPPLPAPRVSILSPADGDRFRADEPVPVRTSIEGMDPAAAHVHIYVDGELASMTDGAIAMNPGVHVIEAELAELTHESIAGGADRVRITVEGDG